MIASAEFVRARDYLFIQLAYSAMLGATRVLTTVEGREDARRRVKCGPERATARSREVLYRHESSVEVRIE